MLGINKKLLNQYKHFFYNKTFIIVLCIVIFAALIRAYNYYQVWEVGGDSARDILIAREAIERGQVPLIGHFSSAGPIIQGSMYYWLIILSYILFPFSIHSPWVLTLFIGIGTVMVLMYCGKLIGGPKLGILVGIIAATSPQLVAHSLLLTNPTFVIVAVSFLLLSTLLLYQRKKTRYAFFMGLSIGAGISFHYQSLNLLLFFITAFFVPKTSIKKKFVFFLAMFFGLFIVSFPLMYWDSQQQWADIRNILDYFLIAQYRLYVPNSWKLFLFEYLPTHWAFMIGGYKIIGLILSVIVSVILFIFCFKRSISRVLFVLIIIFGLFLLVNRYYHGERTEGYMLYLLPFIILFTSWSLIQLIYPKKLLELLHVSSKGRIAMICMILGYGLIAVAIIGNLLRVKQEKSYQAHTYIFEDYTKQLVAKFPNQKFALYDYKPKKFTNSGTLIVFLEFNHKLDKNGMPLSFVNNADKIVRSKKLPIVLQFKEFRIVDISKELHDPKIASDWRIANQAGIYDELMDWTSKRKLTSSFSLGDFIKMKVGTK